MAASPSVSNDLAPTEFSPRPETVRLAVAVLAVAGLVGLWKGAAEVMASTAPLPQARPGVAAAAAQPLPALGATGDTLLPPQAMGAVTPPAPPATAKPVPAAPAETVEAAPSSEAVVERAPPAPEPAPAASEPTAQDFAEPEAALEDEPLPPVDEEGFPD